MKRLLLLLLALCLSPGAAVRAEDFDMAQGFTIGVAVYNPDDAETLAFRDYFENYLGTAFNASFLYSNAITNWEEEKAFIEEMHELGVHGIIASLSEDSKAAAELCAQYGIYYIFGTSSLSDEAFAAIRENPYFLGTIGASDEDEVQAGAGMAKFFTEGDAERAHGYLICTGGASLGNEMHRMRSLAILDALAEAYACSYDIPAEELVLSPVPVEAVNDGGVKIEIMPGYPYVGGLEEAVAAALAAGGIDTVMCAMTANTLIEPIRAAEEAGGIDIRVGAIDCFTSETYDWFNGVYNGGKPEMDYLVGKYGACVAPAFIAICNACSGYAEDFRPNGKAFELTQGYWTASSVDAFNEHYALSVGIYENTYSAGDIMQVLKVFNPDATWEDFAAFTRR